ncbi:MAG: response regulator transcription factor [Alphaproteobacteria bacterium]|nr:response regulator transcription factor [Alphaproteobacteria bacterium]
MLTEFLRGEGFETTAAFNGTDGAIAALDPDLDAVILDVMMPDISGIETLQRIRSSSAVPVIMLTAKGAEDERVAGLEMGADDYIAKPYYARELLARLKAVLRRKPTSQPAQHFTAGKLRLVPANRQVSFDGQPFEVTTCEFDLLEALLRNKDAVATKDELSLSVLGRKREPYDRSIDVHVSNLRKKLLTASSKAIEIETVRAVGYRLKVTR